jgi:hypothetical protein
VMFAEIQPMAAYSPPGGNNASELVSMQDRHRTRLRR